MHYRDVLYSNYSASFAEQKTHNPAVQFAAYEATYDLSPISTESEVLDIGCGTGEWLTWLHQKGYTQLNGIDFSPSDIAIAKQQLTQANLSHVDAVSHLQQQTARFDLIHAKDVIEHMTKDEFIHFLQAAHTALKPGGRIWLRSFNAQAPLSTATRYGDFTHESAHTPGSLAQCLRSTGFQQISIRGFHYCSSSLSGRVRALLSLPVAAVSRLILQLRHGKGGSPGVDLHSPAPDLHAEACKAR
jgi:cyclopropane fatty-acyl-phospholipid synthase-like methyltransferase